MANIGIYGGSFNPPHRGHMLAAREMAEALGLDRIVLVPAADPPHKEIPAGSPDAQTRLELLSLAARRLPNAEADDLELRRGGPSYTADTLRALHARFPGDRLYLLMGSDMFASLHTWHKPEQICKLATVVTARRAGDDSRDQLARQAARLKKEFGAKTILLDNQFLEMSSTEARRMLRFDCAETYLDGPVLDFIREHGLYGVGEDLRGLPFERLRSESLALHDPRRVPHVVGCCAAAAHLARRWGADEKLAARAGILHDVTKALSREAQLLLCEKYGLTVSDFEREHYKLLHSKTGAAVAEHVFGERGEVCSAIYWHTTGRAGMSLLEKILYIADYMEPNRAFDGVEKMRALTETDLDAALLLGFEMSIDLLEKEGKPLDRYTVEARDCLLRERT